MRLAGVRHGLVGLAHPVVVELAGNSHLGTEIVGADQQHVDALCRRDGVGIFYRLGGFQHDDAHCVAVDQPVCLLGADRKARERTEPRKRTRPQGWVAAGVDDGFGLGGAVHMGDDHPLGAAVQNPADMVMAVAGHADQGRNPGHGCG